MSEHRIPDSRGGTLLRSLAGLGVIRTLARAGQLRRCRYDGSELVLDTPVENLAKWLVDEYVPTPVLSPWNGGSGFGQKDKTPKDELKRLLAMPTTRLDDFRAAFAVCTGLAGRAQLEVWEKYDLVRELRNVCPDAMLPWLDASVVQLDEQLAFPPLLGTGGNDGRLDFSTNFHQRLLEILPDANRDRSLLLVTAHLANDSVDGLTRAAVGQFDPGAAGTPGSSPYGAADSLVNPWSFVLMLEGALYFASAPARRLAADARSSSRAAIPFMTFASPWANATATPAEESRGDVWLPYFGEWLSPGSVSRLFTQGRAVWQGRQAVQTSQMYLAAGTGGTDPAARGFERYTFSRRNGLAFSAVRVGSVVARVDASLLIVKDFERWPSQFRGRSSGAVTAALNTLDRTQVEFAADDSSPARIRQAKLRDYLAAVTELDLVVARSTNARELASPRSAPKATAFAELLHGDGQLSGLLLSPSFRIALGLASVATAPLSGAPEGRPMRELLLPLDPAGRDKLRWRDSALVPGLATMRLTHLLADVAYWLALHDTSDAPSARATDVTAPRAAAGVLRGVTGTPWGVRVPASDLNALAAGSGSVSIAAVRSWFLALLAFDWRGVSVTMPDIEIQDIDSLCASMTPFRIGFGPGVESIADAPRYGMRPEWLAQLRAGELSRVQTGVGARLRQLGYRSASSPELRRRDVDHGRRIAASLIPRSSRWRTAFDTVTAKHRLTDDLDAAVDEITVTTSMEGTR